MFCKHEWEVVSDSVLPSAWEIFSKTKSRPASPGGTSILFFEAKHVHIMYCRKCGKVKKTVTSNIS
jgi:Fe2+ or Zn2+ uptake regulation protein